MDVRGTSPVGGPCFVPGRITTTTGSGRGAKVRYVVPVSQTILPRRVPFHLEYFPWGGSGGRCLPCLTPTVSVRNVGSTFCHFVKVPVVYRVLRRSVVKTPEGRHVVEGGVDVRAPPDVETTVD